METIINSDSWEDYFEHEVETWSFISKKEIEKMRDELETESILLELLDLSDTDKNHKLFERTISFLERRKSWYQSLGKAKDIATRLLNARTVQYPDNLESEATVHEGRDALEGAGIAAASPKSIVNQLECGTVDDLDHALFNEGISSDVSADIRSSHFDGETRITNGSMPIAPIAAPTTAALYIPSFSERALVAAPAFVNGYPPLPLDLSEVKHEYLVSCLIEITAEYRVDRDYEAIRDRFVYVSLALNQFGLLAPAFRNQPRIPYAKSQRDDSHRQLLIDELIIDCHWLYCRRESVNPRWPELKSMFSHTSPFDCSLVCDRIAKKTWSKSFRADELLQLSTRQQHQLLQLRVEHQKELYRSLVEGKKQLGSGTKSSRDIAQVTPVRKAINDWAERTHQIRGHQEFYQALWVAKKLLGQDAPIKHVAELAGLQCGTKILSSRTVSEKLKQLNVTLVKAGIPPI